MHAWLEVHTVAWEGGIAALNDHRLRTRNYYCGPVKEYFTHLAALYPDKDVNLRAPYFDMSHPFYRYEVSIRTSIMLRCEPTSSQRMLRCGWSKGAGCYFKYRYGLNDLRSSAIAGGALFHTGNFILVRVESQTLSWP